MRILTILSLLVALSPSCLAQEGFTPIFNGTDLSGWKGLVGNPIQRASMTETELAEAQRKADAEIAKHWWVEDEEIVNDGSGPHLCTTAHYGDFELRLDWKISAGADSGIYLRGSPQVQIWDPVNGHEGTEVGSGGLYNNQKHASRPITRVDKPAGEWNSFRIRMIGEIVSVWLNGALVVDNVPMENYWDRARPIFAREQIELQTHGGEIRFRDIRIREISAEEANAWLRSRDASRFTPLSNGMDLSGWTGSTEGYYVENGDIVCDPARGGNLFSQESYGDFIARFEFRLPPGGNNGFAIRTPRDATNPAYDGMELQVLDNTHPKYANLKPWQYHGSVYGIVPSHRGYLRPVGEWNFEEVEVKGSHVIVRLNGFTILDVDLAEIDTPIDGQSHPGMRRTEGHLVFMGHGDPVRFRNVSVRELD